MYAGTRTSRSTSTIRASGYLSVESAGATSQTKMLSGELHLKDGSVIINVLITYVKRKNHGKRVTLYYTAPTKRTRKLHLREIEWAERLDPPRVHGVDRV